MDCTFTLDPTAVQTALDACMAIIRQPESGPNFLRGLFAVTMLGAVGFGLVDVLRRAVR